MPGVRRAGVISYVLTMCLMLGALVAPPASAQMATNAVHAVLMDAATGQVLWNKDGDEPFPPASMSKLMTLDILFSELKDGRVKLSDTFPVSSRAWQTGGSKMFVKVGTQVPVRDLIKGIIIDSGNDACVVVAQALGGTVHGFVKMMNRRAKELGLKNSHFVNPDGLPEPPGQLMSAHDLAVLARDLIIRYPQYYHYFSERSFSWSGITQPNRNMALQYFPGADGLKTGYTHASGYGIITSAVRNGRRFILVLGGLRYPDLSKFPPRKKDWLIEQRRGQEAARVLTLAFRNFRSYSLFRAGQQVGNADVWAGEQATVPLIVREPVTAIMQVHSHRHMVASIDYVGPLKAPVAKGAVVAHLNLTAPGWPGMSVPLYAGQSDAATGLFGRMAMAMRELMGLSPEPAH
ncbi:MAG: D-alanyl-D-alanine carboxypeptidase [Alphaproteobacteria bacterium]|nr:D-alanyl-D-alanine carboxypeptidase [Alphaproteobacteria bacterium]